MTNSESATKTVLIIGGLLVDDIAIPTHSLKPASSNPVKWQHKLGGVAANVARVAAQQLNTHFITTTGDDNTGSSLTEALASATASHSLRTAVIVRAGKNSDRYTAILDADGELFLGLADAELTAQIQWQDISTHLPAIKPDAVVLDANLSPACLHDTINSLDTHYGAHVPMLALAVSPTKSMRYLPFAKQIDTLFCNRREAAALTQLDWQSDLDLLADKLLMCGFNRFVITDGGSSLLVQEISQRTHIAVPSIRIEKNVNGAGDALAGATIASHVLGYSLATAVQKAGMGAANKVLTGESEPPFIG